MAARFAVRLVLTLALALAALVAFAIGTSAATGTSDISVAKTGPVLALQGDTVTYTLAVTNNGPDDATSVFADDVLPAGETFISLISASGCTVPPAGGTGLVECLVPTLSSGLTTTFTLTVQLAASLPNGTLIRNTAVVQADQTDPVPSNNSSSSTLRVGFTQTDIAVTKTGPATAKPGDDLAYTITVANSGPDDATNVIMSDTLPAGETLKALNFGPGAPPATCSLIVTINCTIPSLASGQAITMSAAVTLSVTVPDGTVLTNTANADLPVGEVDPDPANNSSSSSLTVVSPRTNISITKTGPDTAHPGDDVTYTITVVNNGPDDATDVNMTDDLPVGETLKVFNFGPGAPPATCNLVGAIICSIPGLASGQSITMFATVTISPAFGAGTVLTNTAVARPGPGQLDLDLASNFSSSSLQILVPDADLSVTKSGPATAIAGDPANVTYTIVVTNNGPDDAKDVALEDGFPLGETFVAQSQTAGPAFALTNTGTTIEDAISALPAGATASFTLTVHLSSSLPESTQLTNTVIVGSSTPDANSGNNVASATTLVHSPDTDLAMTAGIDPAPVQATSAAGAVVNFTLPTTSDEDGPVAVTCDATSGAVFPVGSTKVTCSATDADDSPSTVSTTLTVLVVDKDLALAGVPAAATVNATNPAGAIVTYTGPTATDEEGPRAVSCDHPSGSMFPIGQTTVICSATDADDTPSTASATFNVTVVGAAGQLQGLQNFVQGLPPGTSLADKVSSTISFLSTNDTADACGVLMAIINQANAQSGKQLTPAQAAQIVSTAKQIEAVIPCP